MGHEGEKPLPRTEACRGERGLRMPVFSITRHERGLQPNPKIEKSTSFVRKGSAFSYEVIKLWNSLARSQRLDLFLNYCVAMDSFDALSYFFFFLHNLS